MSFHTDFDSWQRMSDPRYCPVCNQAPMPEGMVDVVELLNRGYAQTSRTACAAHAISSQNSM